MTVHYQDHGVTLHHGDCLEVLPEIPGGSVDAVVTDPPYGLGFMGKQWDELPPGKEWAEACMRVLKPGGHLLAFGGTRTWRRLAVAVEDAGFEIRDSIAWMYGSGFPKSLDVAKAIDKGQGENRARQLEFTAWMRSSGITADVIREATGTHMASHYLTAGSQPAIATADLFDKLRPHLPDVPERIERLVAERTGIEWTDYAKREVIGIRRGAMAGWAMDGTTKFVDRDITAPATPDAERWQGWGTALKPAFEPIVVARKPLGQGTVAANVLTHGTGALNIDGCRIATDEDRSRPPGRNSGTTWDLSARTEVSESHAGGRWPANVILDESQAAALDEQSGTEDIGGASRFFYTAKADQSERITHNGIAHPTVKPLDLMRWLVRLVTQPGGTVLEPFAGSGTTIEAALLEGFQVIGIEREADYLPLITQRINRRRNPVAYLDQAGEDLGLFASDGGAA